MICLVSKSEDPKSADATVWLDGQLYILVRFCLGDFEKMFCVTCHLQRQHILIAFKCYYIYAL